MAYQKSDKLQGAPDSGVDPFSYGYAEFKDWEDQYPHFSPLAKNPFFQEHAKTLSDNLGISLGNYLDAYSDGIIERSPGKHPADIAEMEMHKYDEMKRDLDSGDSALYPESVMESYLRAQERDYKGRLASDLLAGENPDDHNSNEGNARSLQIPPDSIVGAGFGVGVGKAKKKSPKKKGGKESSPIMDVVVDAANDLGAGISGLAKKAVQETRLDDTHKYQTDDTVSKKSIMNQHWCSVKEA